MRNKKRLLVTGGAGYIGSHTCSLLKRNGYQIFVLDNLGRGRKEVCRNDTLFRVDLRDKKKVKKIFDQNKFDAVIHFAGLINVGESMEKPDFYFDNNVGGTVNLLNSMSEFGVKYLVFSSSAAVYGNPKNIPVKEDDPQCPTNAYGQTKLMIERMLPFYEYRYGLRSVSFRYFNACGAALDGENGEAHSPEGHLIPLAMRVILGKKKSKFSLFGNDYPTKDGTCVRDYVHVLDLAEAHLAGLGYLISGGESQSFNVGTGSGYSNLEVVQAIKKITGINFRVDIVKRRPGDPAKLIADNKKITRLLGWKAQYSSLEVIIKTAYQWHKTHPFTLEG